MVVLAVGYFHLVLQLEVEERNEALARAADPNYIESDNQDEMDT